MTAQIQSEFYFWHGLMQSILTLAMKTRMTLNFWFTYLGIAGMSRYAWPEIYFDAFSDWITPSIRLSLPHPHCTGAWTLVPHAC